jgi:hypothetical protein
MIFLTYYIDERHSITWHFNLQHGLDWRHSIKDITTYYNDDTWQALEWIRLFKEARFKLKSCLINQINSRWHTILGTQLHNIDILNYYMHKICRSNQIIARVRTIIRYWVF